MKRNKPIRLAKQEEKKPLFEDVNGIPVEFILITIIMISFFALIMIFMGPCTESGIWWNFAHA